jgi:putative transposase
MWGNGWCFSASSTGNISRVWLGFLWFALEYLALWLFENKALVSSFFYLPSWLEYFGLKYGKVTVAVPPHYTSSDCPVCGKRVKKSLSTRTHACSCGYVENRDVAASINILRRGLSTQGHWGTYATGDLPSWAVGANLLSNGESSNVESPRQ